MPRVHVIEKIEELFKSKGGSLYGGEAVTQEQHALQAAKLAEESGASPATIAAALLHDVGHLLHNLPTTRLTKESMTSTRHWATAFSVAGLGPKSLNQFACTSTQNAIYAPSIRAILRR